jgi:phosphinothricin acetyltransferase
MIVISAGSLQDLAECQAIYAHHVLVGTGSFEETPPTLAQMTERFEKVSAAGWSWLVARDGSELVGFGYFQQFHQRSAYRFTAEDSVYVRDNVRGQGVGKAIVAQLLIDAQAAGFRQMIAVIGDSENIGSVGVHASLGFQKVGQLRKVGYKFERWLDVVYMQRALDEAAGDDHPA